jgi:hypothetical protein
LIEILSDKNFQFRIYLFDLGVEGAVEVPATEPVPAENEPDAANEVAPAEPAAEEEEKPKRIALESEEGVQWVAASGGQVPEGALKGGEDNGNALFVARAEHEEAVIPGKLLADHGVAYIPWGGEEHGKESYEVYEQPSLLLLLVSLR